MQWHCWKDQQTSTQQSDGNQQCNAQIRAQGSLFVQFSISGDYTASSLFTRHNDSLHCTINKLKESQAKENRLRCRLTHSVEGA